MAVIEYITPVQVSFTPTGVLQTIDLSAYVASDATIAILQIENTSTTTGKVANVQSGSTSSSLTTGFTEFHGGATENRFVTQAVSLTGGLAFRGTFQSTHIVFVIGQIRGDGVVNFDAMRDVSPTVAATWTTRTLTDNSEYVSGDEVEAVVIAMYWYQTATGSQTIGIRTLGSTVGTWTVDRQRQSMTFFILKVDSDTKYETYATFKTINPTCRFFEVGYIKKGCGYTGISEWGSDILPVGPTLGAWTDLDVTSSTATNSTLAVFTQRSNATGSLGNYYLRPNGGSEVAHPLTLQLLSSRVITLDSSQVMEFFVANDNNKTLYIHGYLEPIGTKLIIDGENLTIDGENLTID